MGRSLKFIDPTGKYYVNKRGENMLVVEYTSANNCKVKFDCGTVVKTKIDRIRSGDVNIPIDRVGEKFITNEGCNGIIIEYINANNCTIKLDNKVILTNIHYQHIKDGCIKNPFHPSIHGIAFVGEGRHKTKEKGKMTKMYYVYSDMIKRCYSKKSEISCPSYDICTVSDYWLNYQNFGDWFEEYYREGFDLDKDVLIKGNKVYSPETCTFVPKIINNLFIKSDTVRGKYPIGVSETLNGRYSANISMYGEQVPLGTFDTPEEAFQAYKLAKESYIKEVADKYRGQITEACYEAMYNYKVEETD